MYTSSLSRLELNEFRNAEKTVKKLSKCDAAILFNQRCLSEEILPKYTQFRSPTNHRTRTSNDTVKFKKNIVIKELNSKLSQQSNLRKQLEQDKLNFLSTCRTSIVDEFFAQLTNIKESEDISNARKTCN